MSVIATLATLNNTTTTVTSSRFNDDSDKLRAEVSHEIAHSKSLGNCVMESIFPMSIEQILSHKYFVLDDAHTFVDTIQKKDIKVTMGSLLMLVDVEYLVGEQDNGDAKTKTTDDYILLFDVVNEKQKYVRSVWLKKSEFDELKLSVLDFKKQLSSQFKQNVDEFVKYQSNLINKNYYQKYSMSGHFIHNGETYYNKAVLNV